MVDAFVAKEETPLDEYLKSVADLFSKTHLRKEFLTTIVEKLKTWTDCQCVGIRVINPEGIMPYEAYLGFSQEFWENENWLSVKDHQCVCTRVVTEIIDPFDQPVLTKSCSVWTNDLQGFGKTIPEELYPRYRGKCIESGFATLAVLAIRHNEKIIGLIHLADTRMNMLPKDKILVLESVAPLIGEVMARFSAEDDLSAKDEWLEETGRTAKVGGWEVDIETSKVYWTRETYRIHGLPPEQGQPLEKALTYFPSPAREVLESAIKKAIETGEPYDLELPFVNSEGDELFVRTICKPIFRNGKLINLRGSLQDITDRKMMEIRLREVQKLEVIGRMAGGIAHNFNNSLAVIMGNIELKKLKSLEVNDSDKYLDDALAAARQARDLVRKILTFSPQDLNRKIPVKITRLLEEIIELINEAIPSSIDVKCAISSESENIDINADPTQFKEAMISLYNNAIFAMNGKGVLTISLDIVELQTDDISAPYLCSTGTCARISIEDTGCGMSSETMKKIFDPFFSTKDVGQGTGVGLSTVQGIVVKHGGMIKVNSALGQGARFELYFPAISSS